MNSSGKEREGSFLFSKACKSLYRRRFNNFEDAPLAAYAITEARYVVPRIQDQYLQTAIFLYRSKKDAQQSAQEGGSGFLVGHREPNAEVKHIYAVTNAHVINDGCTTLRLNTESGAFDTLDLPKGTWTKHPDGDDIAICQVGLQGAHEFKYVYSDRLLTQKSMAENDIGPGDDVFMVGRLVTHSGTIRNLPIPRFGHIQRLPIEDIQNALGMPRPHFLVEMRSISGFSGSPVIVHYTPVAPTAQFRNPFQPFLLGIDCGHLPVHDGKLTAGIAAVVPAWKLTELLNLPEIVKQRNC